MEGCNTKSISIAEYETLLKMLEDERIAHANTKAKLLEAQDKLEFAIGEVEILQKQIQREKAQFESTFGVLKDKALAETSKNVSLENKCHDILREVEGKEDVVAKQEEAIQDLTHKLERQKELREKKEIEDQLQLQQELYINRLMQQYDKKKVGKNS